MKPILVLILSLCIACNNTMQEGSNRKAEAEKPQDSLGFTNKAEAENEMVKGFKEGKWIEYTDDNGNTTTDPNAPIYILTIYKKDKRVGITRYYNKRGELFGIIPYTDGIENGLEKVFYYKTGKIKSQTAYIYGKAGVTRHYDESGNEIKQ